MSDETVTLTRQQSTNLFFLVLFALATPKILMDILHRFLEYYISMLNEINLKTDKHSMVRATTDLG